MPGLGIDLGTTYSAVSTCSEGSPRILLNHEGDRLTPSAVLFTSSETVTGRYALEAATAHPGHVAQFFKRFMGDPEYRFRCDGTDYTAIELSSMVLRKLKQDTTATLGELRGEVVVTVPAYFGDPQRRATLEAAKLAGLSSVHLLNEPTAAVYAYGLHAASETQRVLVFDLGGGTFDVTLAELSRGAIDIKATGGDHQLGGCDWDERLVAYLAEQFEKVHRVDPRHQDVDFQVLQEKAVKAKVALSTLNRVTVQVQAADRTLNVDVTRDVFEGLTRPFLERCVLLTESVLTEARLEPRQVERVLLVGGSTRMPGVAKALEAFFGKPPSRELNPDECVALGAAVKAEVLLQDHSGVTRRGRAQSAGLAKFKDSNVTSHGLGLVVIKDDSLHNSILIPKNTPYPCECGRDDFVVTDGNQDTVTVVLTEGEDADPYRCDLIGHFEVYDLPSRSAGRTRLSFAYKYNRDQIVELEAKDLTHGRVLPVRRLEGIPALSSLIAKPLDVALLMDCSGSMAGTAIEHAKAAALTFVESFRHPLGRIALIVFPGGVAHGFESPAARLPETISRFVANNGTPMTEAVQAARGLLPTSQKDRVIVLFTDGGPNDQSSAQREADQARRDGIRIITLGVAGANDAFLRGIASSPADCHRVGDSVNLRGTFARIATQLSSETGMRR